MYKRLKRRDTRNNIIYRVENEWNILFLLYWQYFRLDTRENTRTHIEKKKIGITPLAERNAYEFAGNGGDVFFEIHAQLTPSPVRFTLLHYDH